MVDLIQILILSVIQGIAEWLPISSSGHLALLQNFFGFQSISFDVFLHLASILAVFVIFWKDIIGLLNLKNKENWKYLGFILIGIIPAGIIGVLFKDQIESFFSSLVYLGIFFMISGVLIYSTKFVRPRFRGIGWFDSLFIGIFQAVAILPGISRSGSTISAGIFRGVKKEEALKFSFLMAIPIVLGAALIELKDISLLEINYSLLITSFIVTFIVSLFTIKVLLRIIKTDKFYLFGIYNFILGIIILIFNFL